MIDGFGLVAGQGLADNPLHGVRARVVRATNDTYTLIVSHGDADRLDGTLYDVKIVFSDDAILGVALSRIRAANMTVAFGAYLNEHELAEAVTERARAVLTAAPENFTGVTTVVRWDDNQRSATRNTFVVTVSIGASSESEIVGGVIVGSIPTSHMERQRALGDALVAAGLGIAFDQYVYLNQGFSPSGAATGQSRAGHATTLANNIIANMNGTSWWPTPQMGRFYPPDTFRNITALVIPDAGSSTRFTIETIPSSGNSTFHRGCNSIHRSHVDAMESIRSNRK
jgi:hypothetical protein